MPLLLDLEHRFEEFGDWIVKLVYNSFFHRDDGIVGDMNVFRADFGAALCDVAEAYAGIFFDHLEAIGPIHRMHLQTRQSDHETRTVEAVLAIVIAQDVTDILAEKTFNALAEFLHAFDVFLINNPISIWLRGKRHDFLIYFVVPGNVSHQVLYMREGLDRLDSNLLTGLEFIHP